MGANSELPGKIGNVIKWATYGWMAGVGIKTFQRRSDEGASMEEAAKEGAFSAFYSTVLGAWFLYMPIMVIAKIPLFFTGAVLHGVIALVIQAILFPIVTGTLLVAWADRFRWQVTHWRMYQYGLSLRENGVRLSVIAALLLGWLVPFFV